MNEHKARGDKTRTVADASVGCAILFVIILFAVAGCAAESNESGAFETTGALYVVENKDWPMDRATHVRDLTVKETAAIRLFIAEGEYEETASVADQADMTVVRIDGDYWYMYRNGMFRKDGGDATRRKVVEGVRFSTSPSHKVDFTELVAWYEDHK